MAAPYNMAWMSLRHPESVIAEVALIGDKLGCRCYDASEPGKSNSLG